MDGNSKRLNQKLGAKVGQGRLPFEASKDGINQAKQTVSSTLKNPSSVSKPFTNSNGDKVMDEVIKEISSRTGAYDPATKKWQKDKSDEAMAKWYQADFSKCKLDE